MNVQFDMNGSSYPARLHSPLGLSAVRQLKLIIGIEKEGRVKNEEICSSAWPIFVGWDNRGCGHVHIYIRNYTDINKFTFYENGTW